MMNNKAKQMKKYKVHQIQISNEIHDDVNRLGHAGAAKKYPAYEAHMAVSFRGSEKFETRFLEHYAVVAEIDAENLEQVFEIGNIWPEKGLTLIRQMHSISVGDIVELKGQYFMVDQIGFTSLSPLYVERV